MELRGPFSVNAPEAWANVAADGRPGGRGVTVAVLDTGVAYANRGPFRRSPDFSRYQFVQGYDFVAHRPYPNDRNGHGTFVAATIAETTDNRSASPASPTARSIMPVRVLNTQGEGEASTIAEGVRFAVNHGAQVINLSLEFSPDVTASDIPELIEALRYAHRRGVLVVAAAGNEGHARDRLPGARARRDRRRRHHRTRLPGQLLKRRRRAHTRGAGRRRRRQPARRPELPPRTTRRAGTSSRRPSRAARRAASGSRSGYEGTSMAAPHVAATAALIIASRVLGRHPTPAQITARLRATARKLGGGGDEAPVRSRARERRRGHRARGGPGRGHERRPSATRGSAAR